MTKQNWEERFEERFSQEWWKGFGTTDDIDRHGIDGIKSFITTLRSTDRDNLIKEVEEINCKFAARESDEYDIGFQDGLFAVIEKIKEYYKD